MDKSPTVKNIYSNQLGDFKMVIQNAHLLWFSSDWYQPSEAQIKSCTTKRTISRGNIINVICSCSTCLKPCNRIEFLDPKGRVLAKTLAKKKRIESKSKK